MIMIIAVIYIFFILCHIWSIVENYFQKILSPPPLEKSHSPLKMQKVKGASPSPFFLPTFTIFKVLLSRKGRGHYVEKYSMITIDLWVSVFYRIISQNWIQKRKNWQYHQSKQMFP